MKTMSSKSDLNQAKQRIAQTISIGAPAYNAGDIKKCANVYKDTAKEIASLLPSKLQIKLLSEVGNEKYTTFDAFAWAMRREFDLILDYQLPLRNMDAVPEGRPTNPLAGADSGGGGGGGRAQRPGLQRTGANRFYVIESQPSANTMPCNSDTAISSSSSSTVFPNYSMRATNIRQSSSRSVFIQNKMKEQQSLFKKLQDMQRTLERATQDATNGGHTEELSETEEMLKAMSSLEEINHQNQSNIRHLQQQLEEDETKMHEIEANYHTQLQQLTSQNESMKVELDRWRTKHSRIEKLNYELIEKMASKALEQLHSHDEMKRAEVLDWKHKYEEMGTLYDELLEKVGDMADENGQLRIKVEQLETSEAETIGGMQQLQSDNATMKVQVNEWREKHETTEKLNAELVEKMSGLAYENGKLLVKCQRLEFKGASLEASTAIGDMETSLKATNIEETSRRSLSRFSDSKRPASFIDSVGADGQDQDKSTLLAVIDEMEVENDALHLAIENAMALANGTKDFMANFVEAHEASVKSYEEKLANMKDELKNAALSNEEMAVALYALKEENKALHIERDIIEKKMIELKANGNAKSSLQGSLFTNTSMFAQYGSHDYSGLSNCMDMAAEAEREAASRIQKKKSG